jgi:trimethylamine--corrinoid protein Co-methyltransferase
MLRTRPEFLSENELAVIHENTLRVMRDVGVTFPVAQAQEICRAHGAKVEGNRVYFPPALVESALASAPHEFTIHARDPRRNIIIGGEHQVFAPGYGAPFVMEMDGTMRSGTMADYDNLVRLADALPNLDSCGYMVVEPGDVDPATAYLRMMRSTLIHSSKPFMGATEGAHGARAALDMARIVFGDEFIKTKPVMLGLINCLSPLGYGDDMLEALIMYAQAGQPLLITPLVQAGASGPITLAGALVQQNAEILAGITLAQLVNPGTPVIYGATSTAIDMSTGGLAIGAPELDIFIALTAQLARKYGVPSRGGGCLTDSHTLDAQAGMESMMSMMMVIQCGINYVLHATGILSSYLAISYEKFMIDDDVCGMVRRFKRGLDVTAESLAMEVIERVGPGGNYLSDQHTYDHCRTEFYLPRLLNRKTVNNWQAKGSKSIGQAAHQAWQKLLAQHQIPTPDAIIVNQLDRYVAEHL